ncbi:MAG: cryptochrome/photolyase family protein [Minwuia sp.]|nr:cryptochrome/photolyase family protein [Minwuia sp.]
MAKKNLILIMGDQLTPRLPALAAADRARDVVLMVEVAEETTYVPHHRKKIAFILSAMRHFATELTAAGWQVDYVRLDDSGNSGSFTGEVRRAVERHAPDRICLTEPGEWRVSRMVEGWPDTLGLPVDVLADNRFLCSREAFADWAEGRKQLRMEYFYREMRRKTGLLMDGDKPVGGRWNFDQENRKPAGTDLFMPRPRQSRPDDTTRAVLDLVADRFPEGFGDLQPFWFAVTRAKAEQARDHFLAEALPRFGDFQDAMLRGEDFLYHSVLSPYINIGLLDPLDLCQRVEKAWQDGDVPLNAAEGFIRQIIGWREYVRGIYWLKMPDYAGMNHLQADRDLPAFYWTGDTGMACVRAVVDQTKRQAYAHHIQRLMVTGTFALLSGINPRQVHEWYLSVYADAFEWVELPNTLGMSQFADGGLLGSKPYAASGSYINRMSDHCGDCSYDVKRKSGAGACPFNPLYWDFLARNGETLRSNPRLKPVHSTWDRMKPETRAAYRESAKTILDGLDTL